MDDFFGLFEAMSLSPITASDSDRFSKLTNDDERLKSAINHLSKHGKPANVPGVMKSAEKALECIEEANRLFASTPWQSLVKMYNEAILYAPPDSSELARAYGNRSAALYDGGLYDESILDIDRALRIGYAENTIAKLYVRKAKCLLILNKKKSPEVKETIDKARKSLEAMDAASRIHFGDILDKLSPNISGTKSLQEIEYDKFLPQKIPKENMKIKGTSSAIKLKYSEQYGRHVVATRDIDAGETLVFQRSYASVLETNMFREYCWHCSKRVRAGVACDQCTTVIYCNEVCRDEAWLEHHDIECSVIPMMPASIANLCKRMVLRLTVRAYKEAGSLQKLKANLDELDSIADPIAKCLTGKVYDDTKYASVYTLTQKDRIHFEHALLSAILLLNLAATTEILGEKITCYDDLLKNRWAIFFGVFILKNYRIHLINTMGVLVSDHEGNLLKRGGTLNPFISMFNHSCDPMVHYHTSGNMNAIIAFQKIKKGQQIFMSYLPKSWVDSASARRTYLSEQFEFCCQCLACLQGWGPWLGLPSHVAPKYPAPIEKQLRHLRKKYKSRLMMSQAAFEDIPEILSVTFSMINYYQHIVEYPTQELIELKKVLFSMYSRISF